MSAPPADYAFLFDDGGMAVEADTLAQALTMRPDLRADQLEGVVCLHTANFVWGFDGDPPWVDPTPSHDKILLPCPAHRHTRDAAQEPSV